IANENNIYLYDSVQINEWNGNRTVQMLIKDMAINEWQLFDYRGRKQHKFFMPFIQQFEKNTILTDDVQEMKDLLGEVDATFITYDSIINDIKQADIL